MAPEPSTREAKLIQYLNEAYGKEKQLETALKAHVSMTNRDAYKKRLREHLKETTAQAKGLERRIKQLGGKAEAVDLPGPDIASEAATKAVSAANKAVSLAKGPLHMIRGTGEAEKLLKNAKTELWNEFEEIGNYIAIEELATALHDGDTAKLAKEFRKQEERMASFLQRLIPQLAKQVVREEVPASERRPAGAASSSRSGTTRGRASSSRNGRSSSSSARTRASSSTRTRAAASSSSSAARPAARRSSAAKPAATRSTGAKPAATGSTGAKPAATRSTAAKRSTSGTTRASSSRAKKS
jgi:ferritin-like metal-binding protein YciE